MSRRPHDIQPLNDLLAGLTRVVLGDKGFIDAVRQQELASRRSVELLTPPLQHLTRRWRKLIETVGS